MHSSPSPVPSRALALIVCACVVAPALGSCRTTDFGLPRLNFGSGRGAGENDEIRGRDREALLPVLRGRFAVDFPDLKLELEEWQSTFVEVTLASVEAEFGQAAGNSSTIGGQTLTGDFDVDYRMREVIAVFGMHSQWNKRFSGDVFIGLGYHYLHLRGTSVNGQVGSNSREDHGVVVGVAGDWQASDWARVYGRAEFGVLRAATTVGHYEAGVALSLSEHVDFLIGYRSWELGHDHGRHDLDLSAQGLMFGAETRF